MHFLPLSHKNTHTYSTDTRAHTQKQTRAEKVTIK